MSVKTIAVLGLILSAASLVISYQQLQVMRQQVA